MPPDGALLPETYHFHRGDSREDVLERMQQSMDAVLAELWQARQEDLPLDSPEEVLTLASIIEKETGVRSEEHTSELQSLMRISYAVFCLKQKKNTSTHDHRSD